MQNEARYYVLRRRIGGRSSSLHTEQSASSHAIWLAVSAELTLCLPQPYR